jgi:hypothetical protein
MPRRKKREQTAEGFAERALTWADAPRERRGPTADDILILALAWHHAIRAAGAANVAYDGAGAASGFTFARVIALEEAVEKAEGALHDALDAYEAAQGEEVHGPA